MAGGMDAEGRYHFWRNGGRGVVIAFVAFLLSLSAVGIAYFGRAQSHIGLCDYPSPRQILTQAKGDGTPSAHVNGIVVERAVRCVSGSKTLSVLTYRNFRNLDTSKTIPDLAGESQARAPGSNSSDVPIQLPSDVVPGKWRLEGFDQLPLTGDLKTWFSIEFEVVP